MSKKPTKSRHRVPLWTNQPDPVISERYQVEIDMSTQRLERRYRKVQKALEAAEKRAANALAAANAGSRKARRRHMDLQALVDDRRRELHEIELLMIPASYNGRDSRRRLVRLEAGAIEVPLGNTTGHRPKQQSPPTFPVVEH